MYLMNRKLLLGAAFFFAGIHVSAAGDLPLPATDDSDWTGLYGTLSLGHSEVKLDGEEFDSGPPPGSESDTDKSDGGMLGLGLGYNHDFGDFVLGLESDVSLLTNDNTLEMKNTVEADYDWFATGRLRAGYDFDGTMLYATGGLALLAANFEDDEGGNDDETYVGWTMGGGLEHKVSQRVSLRLEAIYADFPREHIELAADDTDIEAEMFLVRGGVSLWFLPHLE